MVVIVVVLVVVVMVMMVVGVPGRLPAQTMQPRPFRLGGGPDGAAQLQTAALRRELVLEPGDPGGEPRRATGRYGLEGRGARQSA